MLTDDFAHQAEVGGLAPGDPAVRVHVLEDHLLPLDRLDPPQPDVGGNRAGTQSSYRAYGLSGQSITTSQSATVAMACAAVRIRKGRERGRNLS